MATTAALRRWRKDLTVGNSKQVLESVAAKPLVKSRRRVQDHAEVLTPAWLVDDMLNLVTDESDRIDSRFLEPACGDGNFLVPVLARKLVTVKSRYGKSDFEMRHQALLALMSIYGIEKQSDNAADCRQHLLQFFGEFLGLMDGDELLGAARAVLEANIVQGDAVAMTTVGASPESNGQPIVFAEWGYLGRGKYQRRDFRFDALATRSTVKVGEAQHEVFQSVRMYSSMTVRELATS
jgi:hypothetical protein